MGRITLLPVVLALTSLAGCIYDYPPPPAYHETVYYPSYYPPPGGTVVVYQDQDRGYFGWRNYARDKGWGD